MVITGARKNYACTAGDGAVISGIRAACRWLNCRPQGIRPRQSFKHGASDALGSVYLIPRPRGLASPLARVPRDPPRLLAVPRLPPPALVVGAGMRDARGVWYLDVGVALDEVGGFSTNDVSVVLQTRK